MGLNWRLRVDMLTDDPKIAYGNSGCKYFVDHKEAGRFINERFGLNEDQKVEWSETEETLELGFLFTGIAKIDDNSQWEFFMVSLDE